MQDKHRIKLAPSNNTADVSGGYLMEFSHEQNPDELPTVNGTITNKQWLVLYPKQKNLTAPQLEYMQRYVTETPAALAPD